MGMNEVYEDDLMPLEEDKDLLPEDEAEPEFSPDGKYSSEELVAFADKILREDSNRELCRKCKEKDESGDYLPYGTETGMIESVPQFTADDEPLLDDDGNQLYLDFPELKCEKGHRWFQGEGRRRDIRGPNPILFESHLYNRKRREIYVKDGIPDPAFTMDRFGRPTHGMYNVCVDDQTQALTPNGWRRHDELIVGDTIWTYDIQTDRFEWGCMEDVYERQYEGLLGVLESQNISARTTEGHRWPVVHEEDKTNRYEVVDMLTHITRKIQRDLATGRIMKQPRLNTLSDRHYIRLPIPTVWGSATQTQCDLFELLGWILSDGTYHKGKASCAVTQALHNPKVSRLRDCLSNNGIEREPASVDQNNVGTWRIPAEVGHKLRSIAPVKTVACIPLDQFSWAEYHALYRGILLGDGCVRASTEIYTTKQTEADAIQALCTIIGHPTKQRRIENPQAFCPLEFVIANKQSPWAYVRPARKDTENYRGIVWCPTVPSGFWVARRNGTVYTTGNSHPEGRKINTKNQRAKNGASYYR